MEGADMHFKKEGCDKKQIALDTYMIERGILEFINKLDWRL